ncbi:phosphonate dehydrogenase [Methyloligella solikamskensis]
MAKIVVTNRIHADVRERLEAYGEVVVNAEPEPWPQAELERLASDAHALMTFMPDSIGAAELRAMPELKLLACALKGFDNFDIEACTLRGVWVTIVPDLLTVPTAELTIGLTIGLARHVMTGDSQVRSGFEGWRPTLYGTGLAGSRVGVLGIGAIGKAILQRLAGFEVDASYWDKAPLSPEDERKLGARFSALEPLLRESNFVICALPLTPQTLHIMNETAIAQLKPGAFLINPARGSLVDESAVADALENGRLAGYAADVFEMEDWAREDRPRQIEPRLLAMADRTLFTPHLGSAVSSVRHAIEMEAARSIIDFLEGRSPRGAVNSPAQRVGEAETC